MEEIEDLDIPMLEFEVGPCSSSEAVGLAPCLWVSTFISTYIAK